MLGGVGLVGRVGQGRFGGRVSAAASAFSPTIKGTRAVLSNGNRDLTSTGGWTQARGTLGKSTGLWYFEAEILTVTTFGPMIGVADATTTAPASLDDFFGAGVPHTGGFWSNGGPYFSGIFTIGSAVTTYTAIVGDKLQLAVNFTNGSIWVGRNNTWDGATPSTGTTGRALSFTPGPTFFPSVAVENASTSVRIATGAAQLTYAPPASFSAWG
jgi:hypothetical protein